MMKLPLNLKDTKQAVLWCDEIAALCQADPADDIIQRLAAIACYAPHLHNLIKKYPQTMWQAACAEITAPLAQAEATFQEQAQHSADNEAMMQAVRAFRHRTYGICAIAELCGHMTIAQQVAHLSRCASLAVNEVVAWLCDKYQITPASLIVLGMGKAGAEELNYSSDIDLIFFYDAERANKEAHDYVALTKKFIEIMQKQTKDGFGWRIDLRLRPDPGATSICLSVQAALTYYESIARSWERAIYIRARPIAGNLVAGHEFLEAISPFVWRRGLDYSLLDDLTNWISHKSMPVGGYGFDVKKGAYAIRHIEMATHLLQLLHGGKDNSLRSHHTATALDALEQAGYLALGQAEAMTSCYYNWRQIEHRIQYIRDSHSYSLPKGADEMVNLAQFCGYDDRDDFVAAITELQNNTKLAADTAIMRDMLTAHSGLQEQDRLWPAEDDAQTALLTELGYERIADIQRIIAGWRAGRLPATRSEKAQYYLEKLLPLLLSECAKPVNGTAPDCDGYFMGFVQLVDSLPAGAQFFALLSQHDGLISLIAHLAVNAPDLVQQLAKHPAIFDQMLRPDFFAPLSQHADFEQLADEAIAVDDPELALRALQIMAHEARFRAQMHIITKPDTAPLCGPYLSALHDALLRAIITLVQREFTAAHGTIEHSHFAVILLGRAGLGQMTPRSDMDVLFLYEADRLQESDGPRPLYAGPYFQKLVQRILSWAHLESKTGKLMELDTRLRPDGNAGPIAIQFESWQSYLQETAWPFEKLALRKARILMADKAFADKLSPLLATYEKPPLADTGLRENLQLIRDKLAESQPAPWDVKKCRGGLLDLEFLSLLDGDTNQAVNDAQQLLDHITFLKSVYLKDDHNHTLPPAMAEAVVGLLGCEKSASVIDALHEHCEPFAKALDKLLGN